MSTTNTKLPSFLIAGTARSGTTALHEHLGKHPDIFMPLQKEPCFFTFYGQNPEYNGARHNYINDTATYLALAKDGEGKIWGESSTPYMYFYKETIANIKALVPHYQDIKIILILRDPSERAYSQYMHNRRDLREPLDFEAAIAAEKQRMQDNWHFDFFYVDKGFYYHQVKAFTQEFRHVKILFFEDFESNPGKAVEEVLEFLELPMLESLEEVKKRNQSGEMKVKWIKRLMSDRTNPILNGIRKLMSRKTRKQLRNFVKNTLLNYNLKKVEMSAATRKQLIEVYRTDIEQLADLTGRDLSKWLQ